MAKTKGLKDEKTLIATWILFSSGLLYAEPESYVQIKSEELCQSASYFASLAFEGRQHGEKKTEFLEMLDEVKDVPSAKKGYFKGLLNDAYSKPIYSSDEEIKSERLKFNDDTYKDCMKQEH